MEDKKKEKNNFFFEKTENKELLYKELLQVLLVRCAVLNWERIVTEKSHV